MAKLLGFEIVRAKENPTTTIALPEITDDLSNSIVVGNTLPTADFLQYGSSVSTSAISENDYIRQYREIALYHEVEYAVDEIISEAIIADENQDSIKIDLSNLDYSEEVKDKIREAYRKILNLLNFKIKGYEIFRKWYVDGRLPYHIIIDEDNLKLGIVELRYLDPLKIKKIRKPVKDLNTKEAAVPNAAFAIRFVEYYEYNEFGVDSKDQQRANSIIISPDSVAFATSGRVDPTGRFIISYLHNSIAPANKLKSLENATVIYRLVRAPERRIFYIDVGDLPKARAEQFLHSVMQRYKTKLSYDAISGKIRDERGVMSMTEDYFIPRRGGSKATEIGTVPGSTTFTGNVDELEYFKKDLYKSLKVPYSRIDGNTVFSSGNGEISREEAKFSKFITRLRTQFSTIFDTLLGVELVLTKVMSIEEWQSIKQNVKYDYLKDNYFVELLESDMLASRLGLVAQIEPYIGRFVSNEYVQKNILKMTDEEIEIEKKRIAKEKKQDINAHVPAQNVHDLNHQMNLGAAELDNQLFQDPNIVNEPNPFKQQSQ